jgi:hypothetical protein
MKEVYVMSSLLWKMQEKCWHFANLSFLNLLPHVNPDITRMILKNILNFQMAGRARRGQNERIPPPPPPPPTMQELMAQQNEILL